MLTFAAALGATVTKLSKDRVKASVKTIAFIAISLFALVASAVAYSTSKGYTQWLFRARHAVVTVNGMRSEGWLHRTRSGNGVFLTEHSSGRNTTYDLVFTDSGNGYVLSCGTWVAPRWPVIPVGDVNPPCFLMGSAGHDLTRGTNSVSFTTLDGRKFASRLVIWFLNSREVQTGQVPFAKRLRRLARQESLSAIDCRPWIGAGPTAIAPNQRGTIL